MADDAPELREDTLAALREVMAAKEAAELAAAGEGGDTGTVPLAVPEDWGLSQFWYAPETSTALATEIGRAADAHGGDGPIAFLACPSTFKAFLALGMDRPAYVFEVDERFASFGDKFVHYDFNKPMDGIPDSLMGACAAVVMDPPFLNPDCLQAFTSTTMLLAKDLTTTPIMVCTGAVMCKHAKRLLDARPTKAVIKHEGSRLSNPFAAFITYDDPGALGGWDEELEAAEVDDEERTK